MKPYKPTGRRSWKDVLRPYTERVQPLTKVAERIATIAVHIKEKPSLLSMAGLAAAGVNAIDDLIEDGPGGGYGFEALTSKGHTTDAFRAAGATVSSESRGGRGEVNIVSIHGMKIHVDADGELWLPFEPDAAFLEWMRQLFDRTLPQVMSIHSVANGGYLSQHATLAPLSSKQGTEIRGWTLPLLGAGRCILLEGRPGVGKTTCAQEIAREANLGRTILINSAVVGQARDDDAGSAWRPRSRGPVTDLTNSLRVLSPGVIIVDDVDKVALDLRHLEALRATSKLVILTANNGQHDEVLDAALMRAGRIDEVFTIVPEHSTRRAPFDKLDDKTWEEVREWPIAYLNEIEQRLQHRSGELRIDDLRTRVAKKTRSGSNLFE